jgi:tetratricopeptide (TPR) repeat protein
MMPARSLSVALLSLCFAMGCGASTKPANHPDEVVPLEGTTGANAAAPAVEAASSPEVSDAMKAIEAKRYTDAKSLLDKALAKNPKDAQAHYYMGVTLSAEGGDLKSAIQHYEQALEIDPKLVDAYVNLSALKLEGKDAAGALSVSEKGLSVAPKQPDLTLNRALALEALGKTSEALAAYGDAVQVRPDDFTLKVSYAQLLAQAKKKPEALAQVSAIRECPDPRLLTMGAIVALGLDAPADCIALMDRGIKIEQHPALYVRRGMCRDKLKDVPGATADFKKAVELDGKFAPAHYYLGLLVKVTDKAQACKELGLAADLGGTQGIGPSAKKDAKELGCK